MWTRGETARPSRYDGRRKRSPVASPYLLVGRLIVSTPLHLETEAELSTHGIERAPDERVNWKTSAGFLAIHALVLGTFFTGISKTAVILFVVLYWSRMFFITAGYHRYFAHRSYKLGRGMQFLMAFGGATAAQKGPLWWASHHRNHHRYIRRPMPVSSRSAPPIPRTSTWS